MPNAARPLRPPGYRPRTCRCLRLCIVSECAFLHLLIENVASMDQAATLVPALREFLNQQEIYTEGTIEPKNDGSLTIYTQSQLLSFSGSTFTAKLEHAITGLVSDHAPEATVDIYWIDPPDDVKLPKD